MAEHPSTFDLNLWPTKNARRIRELIAACAMLPVKPYAVFDADNTLWHHDLLEALMAYLEAQGVLTPARLATALPHLAWMRDDESLFACYRRLSARDIDIGYAWIICLLGGMRVKDLYVHLGEMINQARSIPVFADTQARRLLEEIPLPKVFAAQRQLIACLNAAGIGVYIVTASPRLVVQMAIAGKHLALDIDPARIIGVDLALHQPQTGNVVSTKHAPAWPDEGLETFADYELQPFITSPASWYQGKAAAIRDQIDPVIRPMLVVGDSPSDFSMLFITDVGHGGLRIFVGNDLAARRRTAAAIRLRANRQRQSGRSVDAHRNWIFTSPQALMPDL